MNIVIQRTYGTALRGETLTGLRNGTDRPGCGAGSEMVTTKAALASIKNQSGSATANMNNAPIFNWLRPRLRNLGNSAASLMTAGTIAGVGNQISGLR